MLPPSTSTSKRSNGFDAARLCTQLVLVWMAAISSDQSSATAFVIPSTNGNANMHKDSVYIDEGWRPNTPRRPLARSRPSRTSLHAKPRRVEENVDGPLYVNEKCINCAACSHFAPTIFARSSSDTSHIVSQQPTTEEEILQARASLSACPVAAIRVESNADRSHRGLPLESTPELQNLQPKLAINPIFNGLDHPFPRPVSPDVMEDFYFVGHHNDKSFGATPYLVGMQGETEVAKEWIMVDTPRYGKSAIEAVEKITGKAGPKYLFLTHVDDTADHGKWKEHYPGLKRIFHGGDLGRHNWIGDTTLEDVEVLIRPPDRNGQNAMEDQPHAYTLEGKAINNLDDNVKNEFVILHTPGHSPGSITLWKRPTHSDAVGGVGGEVELPGVIFTGDTYGYTTREGGHMTGFPRFGNDLRTQVETLGKLAKMNGVSGTDGGDLHNKSESPLAWSIVAPGHGHCRDYTKLGREMMEADYQDAKAEMNNY